MTHVNQYIQIWQILKYNNFQLFQKYIKIFTKALSNKSNNATYISTTDYIDTTWLRLSNRAYTSFNVIAIREIRYSVDVSGQMTFFLLENPDLSKVKQCP